LAHARASGKGLVASSDGAFGFGGCER
jgi:hypothetical protein